MSYQSPVEIITSQMQTKIEGEVYSAVQRVGIDVDKDELLKALRYDRGQYEKGYKDRDNEIVRCKDCKYRPIKPEDYENGFDLEFHSGVCPCQCTGDPYYSWCPDDNWFCADGERRSNNERSGS